MNFENDYLKLYNEFSSINMQLLHKIRQWSAVRKPYVFCFIRELESLVLAFSSEDGPSYIAEITLDSGSFRHLKQ